MGQGFRIFVGESGLKCKILHKAPLSSTISPVFPLALSSELTQIVMIQIVMIPMYQDGRVIISAHHSGYGIPIGLSLQP